MRTPAGFDCRFFYGDYFRGNNREECRLVNHPVNGILWTPDLCSTCPVPKVIMANACPNLEMIAHVEKYFLGFKKHMVVHYYCSLSKKDVSEPEIGCGKCHTIPSLMLDKDNR